MKIEVLQEQLFGGVTVVTRAVATRAQLPALSHILIEARKEGLVLSATDLEIGMQAAVPAKVIEEGRTAVPAKMLLEFLGSLNPGKLTLVLEKQTLSLSSGGYSAKFQTLNPEEFPTIPTISAGSELCNLEGTVLAASVARVAFASARDSLRPVLTGVLCELYKKKIRLVATDGFRLAIEEFGVENKGEDTSFLIPSRVLSEVVRLAPAGNIKVGRMSATNQIYFVVEDVQVISQVLDGSFPDYQKILPKEFGTVVSVSRNELTQAIKAMYIFARENSNMVRWQVEEGRLVLLATSSERGESRAEIAITLVGEPLEILFNVRYVLDYLSIAQGEQITVSLGGKLAPGKFAEKGRDGGQYIVMPINA